ncbi:hypothetical protein HPP92_017044 [Vanilla planifolia]|uniref:Uncharacterized protein n=1 Tax=Vanilla planifolia TaxID=51239 RepID=A0A835QDC3_VANPL|nr:hypothetical protein HPP92_017044 [Vanilla planifolia]
MESTKRSNLHGTCRITEESMLKAGLLLEHLLEFPCIPEKERKMRTEALKQSQNESSTIINESLRLRSLGTCRLWSTFLFGNSPIRLSLIHSIIAPTRGVINSLCCH